MSEDSMHELPSGSVETLNRFLANLVEDTWHELDRALRITESLPEFSGILPLGDPALLPYFDKPGVFFILGPAPRFKLLHVGASRGPVGLVIHSRLEKAPDGGYVWRWERRSDPPPAFAAVATMEEYWAYAPAMRNFLTKRLGAGRLRPEEEAEGTPPLV